VTGLDHDDIERGGGSDQCFAVPVGAETVGAVEPRVDRTGCGPEVQQDLAWAHIAEVAIVPRIPLNARHNAKIDYPALRRMLGS
jgi:hypothetical protein